MSFHGNLCLFLVFILTTFPHSFAFKYEGCPGKISVDTPADSATVSVTWKHPYLVEVGKTGSVSQTVSHNPGEQFPIGMTRVNYLAINSTDYRDLQICTFVIDVHDPVPPVFNTCPVNVTTRLGPDQDEVAVTWDIPQALDNSAYVQLLSTNDPGDNFTAGATVVTYTARDTTGNQAHCTFTVNVIPFLVATTTLATTTTTKTTTTLSSDGKVTVIKSGGGQPGAKSPRPGAPGIPVTAAPVDMKLWATRGLIFASVLLLLCLVVIALVLYRRRYAVKRLQRLRGDVETEIYPSSAGEEYEYDTWEDPPDSNEFHQGNQARAGMMEASRVNKSEVRPLLVAGGH